MHKALTFSIQKFKLHSCKKIIILLLQRTPIASHHTTCTVAKALNVTFLGNSGAGEPLVLMTGLSAVGLDLSDSKPADAASSLRRCEKPLEPDVVAASLPSTTSLPETCIFVSCVALGTAATVAAGCKRYIWPFVVG